MNEDLDELLESGLLEPPADFSERVMQRIAGLPLPARRSRSWEILQWLALAGGGILAIAQLAGFMFGVWAAVAAG
jgi:hypothetical protein